MKCLALAAIVTLGACLPSNGQGYGDLQGVKGWLENLPMVCAKETVNIRESITSSVPAQTLKAWPILDRPVVGVMRPGDCLPLANAKHNGHYQGGYRWLNVAYGDFSGWVAQEFVYQTTLQNAP